MDVPDEDLFSIVFRTVHPGVDIEQRVSWVLGDRHELLVPWLILISLIWELILTLKLEHERNLFDSHMVHCFVSLLL